MASKVVNLSDWTPGIKGYYSINVGGQLFGMESAEKAYTLTSPKAGVARFELRDGDQHWWDVGESHTSERAEIADRSTLAHGTPLHISYDFMLEKGAANTAKWMVLGQLHQDLFEGNKPWSPPFAVAMLGEKMVVDIRYSGADGEPVLKHLFVDVNDIDRGHVYDIDIKAVFDPNGGGRLVVTRDGVTIADYSGPLGYVGHNGVYWAEGIYRDGDATETVAAQFGNLKIETGSQITIPDSSQFIWAPELKVASIGAVDAKDNRTVEVSGTAKVGTVVSIYEKDVLLGKAKVDANGAYSLKVQVHSDGEHLLNAIATAADGRNGILSNPMTIEIGTAAEIVARMPALAGAGNVGTIVLTDVQTLTLSSRSQLSEFLSYSSTLKKIEGDIKFEISTAVTGQSYNKQTEVFSETGVILERLRYSGSKLVVDEKISPDGHSSTWFYNNDGTSSLNESINGKILSSTQFNAKGIPTFASIFNADGSKELDYFDGVTGAKTKATVYTPEGTRTETYFGIADKDYTKQVYSYDKAGKVISLERMNDKGVTVFLRDWLADGTTETHSYNAAGKETGYTIAYADGSRAEGNFTITGQPYAGQVIYYSKTNVMTMRERLDADGHIKTQEVFGANASVKTYAYDAKSGALTGWTTVAADKTSVTVTLYPGSETKIAKSVSYDAKGAALKTEYFDTNGHSLGSTAPDTTTRSYSYDQATGLKDGFTVKAADGSYTVTKFVPGNEKLVTGIEKFGADGSIKVSEGYDGKGVLLNRKSFLDDGSVQTDRFDADGAKLQTQKAQADGSWISKIYDKATGAETSALTINADKSRTEANYAIKDKSYTKQIANYDSSGKLVESARYYADGKMAFDQKTNPDGTQTVQEWSTSGVVTGLKVLDAKGTILSVTVFDKAGLKVQTQDIGADGSRTTHYFDKDTGLETNSLTVNADKSRTVANYDIKDKPYSQQSITYDVSGKVLEASRFYADGTMAFDQKTGTDGSGSVQQYDTFGRATSKILTMSDGTKDAFAFTYLGNPSATADASAMRSLAVSSTSDHAPSTTHHDHFSSKGVREWSDVTNADGSHVKTAYVTGVTLESSTGNDTLVGIRAGGDTFKFSDHVGHDTIQNFQAGGSSGLDIIALNNLLAESFGQVKDKMVAQGADTLITFDGDNSILVKGVAPNQLTDHNFKFIPHDILAA